MTTPENSNDWAKNFETMQRQYWSAWTDMAKQAAPLDALKSAAPWHEGLEQWSRMFAGSHQQSEVVEKMLSSTKQYLAMAQSMFGQASGQNAGADNAQAWTETMRNAFNFPGMDSSFTNNPMAQMLRDAAGKGAQGFEQMMAPLAPWVAAFKQETLTTLAMPTFGHDREQQEHKRKLATAWIEYQEAIAAYNALMMKSSQHSFVLLENKLAEHSEPGRQLGSMRALYDLWVDAAEEAYAEVALSPEFRKVYGAVVNAQTQVRALVQKTIERHCASLGMPTRTEINTLQQRMQEMRRGLKQQNEAESGNGLADQIAALRDEVAALRKQVAAKPLAPVASTADVKTSGSGKR